ncbi:hypothetical protein PENTCL1PPCAC_3749, partial [Pristionchus entomophagus]
VISTDLSRNDDRNNSMGRSASYKISPHNLFSTRDEPFSTAKEVDEEEEGNTLYGHFENKHGIHWIIVSILIVGEMAGRGLVALPSSMVDAGIWAGAALTIISALASGYTGIQLGENWLMMQYRWTEYRHSCRKPYPEMAYRALGTWGRVFKSILMSVQQFYLSVVFLLLASNNISSLLFDRFSIKVNFCFVALIVTVILLPLLMLGSPKDFWQAGLIAVISTSTAIVLIFIGAAHDQGECMKYVEYPPVAFDKFFLAYGTIMFAYGGHDCFPTFQHDMKKPQDFSKSVIVGYIIIIIMYLPVAVYGYIVYGGSLTSGSVNHSISASQLGQAVNILITLHVIFTEIIVISPLTLTLEELFRIPNKFGIGRVILRTIIMIAVLFMALSIPKFGPIVDLIGGSSVTLITMILPGIFSLSLVAGKKKKDHKVLHGAVSRSEDDNELPSFLDNYRVFKPWLLILNFIIIAFGLFGGVASTISAFNELISTSWDVPCYVQLFIGTLSFNADNGLVNCCCEYRNLTTVDVTGEFCA